MSEYILEWLPTPQTRKNRGDLPIWGHRAEGGGAGTKDEFIKADEPEPDVLGSFPNEIRSFWDDTSAELNVETAALAMFGLGVYIGKRTR